MTIGDVTVSIAIAASRKTRRQRQRESHQTNDLMSKRMAVHVRYNSWYISLPSSAKQQRKMTKFCVVSENVFLFSIERIRSIFIRGKCQYRQTHLIVPNKCEIPR